jgi:DNA-binding MarR family transcriptional regulator
MTAKEICTRARIHKTKVSRAVAALETRRFVKRKEVLEDRRHALLKITAQGRAAFQDLFEKARSFDDQLTAQFGADEEAILRKCLRKLAKLD